MTDAHLWDACKTLFLAGHETTALALSWTWWLLAQNPEAKRRLHDELKHVLNGRIPTLADLSPLHFTERVVKEPLRVMPPAWAIQRAAVDDVEIIGSSGARYQVPKGRDVLMSPYADDPDQFKPERWTAEFAKPLPTYTSFS